MDKILQSLEIFVHQIGLQIQVGLDPPKNQQ